MFSLSTQSQVCKTTIFFANLSDFYQLYSWDMHKCKKQNAFVLDFCFEKERNSDEEEDGRGRDSERQLRAANPKSLRDFVALVEPSPRRR